MLSAEENALLTGWGRARRAGSYLRRYWQPVCYAAS